VHLREAFLTPGHLGISMEYATSGDLLDYVEAHMAHVRGMSSLRWLSRLWHGDTCHRSASLGTL
jgi:hypothetical protein